MRYFITPRVFPPYKHYSNELSVCDAFDYTDVSYISDTYRIIITVFKAQFIQYTKYTKYAFLLLLSIFATPSVYNHHQHLTFIIHQPVLKVYRLVPLINKRGEL